MTAPGDPAHSTRARALPYVFFVALFALLVLSNQLDWDQFFSFFEVERRSWLLDHVPPRWSYQLCAGSSRLGDPQAFGLSPLFAVVLAFGSFWGAKILPLGCVILGWIALRRALGLLFPSLDRELRGALALFYLLGDFFLWHLHAGHLTFALIPLAFVPIASTIALFRDRFETTDAIYLLVAGAALLSAGFYPAVVFFLVPVLLCLGLPACALGLVPRPKVRALVRWGASVVGALVLSAHKWLGVIEYQRRFPRTLSPDRHVPEHAISFLETLSYQLSQTRGHGFLVAPSDWGPWDVWEYAACSGITILALALGVRMVPRRGPVDRRVLLWLLVACLGYLSLTASETSAWSLHRLLNQTIFAGSVRVIGRYGLVLQTVLLVFAGWRLAVDEDVRAWARRRLLPAGYLLTAINLASLFALVDPAATLAAMCAERVPVDRMQTMRFVRPRSTERPHAQPYRVPSSYMYPAIARGEIVPNCYQPLRRPRTLTTEAKVFGAEVHADDTIDLVDTSRGEIPTACRDSVRLTQSRIDFDGTACPSDLCLSLNAINLYADEPFALDEEPGRYCRTR